VKEIFEAQNKYFQKTFDKAISNYIATKNDILDIKLEMLNIKHELKQDVALLGKKNELLRKEFEGKFNLLYWMLGFSLAISVSIVFKLYS
jgi:hypothetical protein